MVEIVQEIERMALMVRENLEFSTRALIENEEVLQMMFIKERSTLIS